MQFRWLPVSYTVVPGVGSIIYPGLGETSDWRENIYAGYLNGVFDLPWLTIEAGLRAEQTDVAYTLDPANIYYPRDDAYSYFRLFPNVRLTKELGAATRVSVFYNRRVDRPGEPELRVFPKYDDPELLKVGNPYLRTQFTTAYEASLQQDWSTLKGSFALYRREISDAYQRIYAIDETATRYDIINKIFANTGKATNSGAELIAQWKARGGLTLNGSLNAFHIEHDPAVVTLLFPYVRDVLLEDSSDFTWDAKLGAEVALGSSIKLQANGVYYAAREIARGSQAARGSFDLAATRTFADERFKLSLTAIDILNTIGTRTRVDGIGFDALYENFYETQMVILSVKYAL